MLKEWTALQHSDDNVLSMFTFNLLDIPSMPFTNFIETDIHYTIPDRGTVYCYERVCVWLSVIISSKLRIRSSTNFSCMLPMAMPQSSTGDVEIHYGFTDDAIFAYKLRLFNVTARLRPKCSLGLGV